MVLKSGMSLVRHISTRKAGASRSLVTTMAGMPGLARYLSTSSMCSTSRLFRYPISAAPNICSLSGWSSSRRPVRRSPGFWMREVVTSLSRPRSPAMRLMPNRSACLPSISSLTGTPMRSCGPGSDDAVLSLGLDYYPVYLGLVVSVHELRPEVLALQQMGDARQNLQVRGSGILRGHDNEEQVDGKVVHGA